VAQPAVHEWLRHQCGVATRQQLVAGGLTAARVEAQVEGGRWRELNEHVLVTHNGPLTAAQRLWAVDLSTPIICAVTVW